MINPDYERSLKWDSPKFSVEETEKAITIRGVAVPAGTTSRNNRHYTSVALAAGAGSFIGKPLTVNHDNKKLAGNVAEMWYDEETDMMRYKAVVKNQPYLGLIRSKSATIRGVSIEADYLFNRCRDCGEKFYTAEQFKTHAYREHLRTVSQDEPHGLKGKALSIVLSPEEPGVPGATLEIAEKNANKDLFWLLETVINNVQDSENMVTPKPIVNDGPPYQTGNPQPKPEKIVEQKATVKEYADLEACLADGHSEEECAKLMKQEPPKAEEKAPVKLPILEKLALKEEDAKFDFDACLASGKSEEECAAAAKEKRVTKETLQAIKTKTNEIIEAWNSLKLPQDDLSWNSKIDKVVETLELRFCSLGSDAVTQANEVKRILAQLKETIDAFPKDDLGWKDIKPYDDTPIKTALETMNKTYEVKVGYLATKEALIETAAKIPAAYDDKPLREMITQQKKDFDALLDAADKSVKEYFAANKKELTEKDATIKELKEKLEQSIKETAEAKTLAENVNDKLKPQYKGAAKAVAPKAEVSSFNPYKQ